MALPGRSSAASGGRAPECRGEGGSAPPTACVSVCWEVRGPNAPQVPRAASRCGKGTSPVAVSLFAHDCGPYCRGGNHAAVVWSNPDPEYTPCEIFRMCCERVGTMLVHVEEASEVGPIPAGVVVDSLNIETWQWGPIPLPADSRPYLVVWRAIDGS
jgi:hypothetical protein